MHYPANVFKKITSLIIKFLFINPFFVPLLLACFATITSLRMEIAVNQGYIVPLTDPRGLNLGGAYERKLDKDWLAKNSYKYTHFRNYERISELIDVPQIGNKDSLLKLLEKPDPVYVRLELNPQIQAELTISKAQLDDHFGLIDSDLVKSSWFPHYFTASSYNSTYPYLVHKDKLPSESLQGDGFVNEMGWTVHKALTEDKSYLKTFVDIPNPAIYLKESSKVEIVCPILEVTVNRYTYKKYQQTGPYRYPSNEEIMKNIQVLSDRDCLNLFKKGADLSDITIEGVLWHTFKYSSFEEMSKKESLYNMWSPVLSQNSAPSMLSITRVFKNGKEVYSFKNIYAAIEKYNKEIRSFTRKPQTIAMAIFTAIFMLAFVLCAGRLIWKNIKTSSHEKGLSFFNKLMVIGYTLWVLLTISGVSFLTYYALRGYWPLWLDFIMSKGYSY